ncbi:Hypothetical predicted protein [Octopus vulgaris]|uniref:Uncharacterized protein n=1 Tax=Octopus vulgaris TaxID=6645 RepID=A0AA36F6P8_OCTVU|nr:Hypothetical predicted protein [Octopus vulgaris]
MFHHPDKYPVHADIDLSWRISDGMLRRNADPTTISDGENKVTFVFVYLTIFAAIFHAATSDGGGGCGDVDPADFPRSFILQIILIVAAAAIADRLRRIG